MPPIPPNTINNYDDLIARCGDWLYGRTDLVLQVPVFIRLFEAKANRNLLCRQMEKRVVTTIDITALEPEFIALPFDFHSMRRVRLIKTSAEKPKLKFMTGQQMDDQREKSNNSPGDPVWFSIFGNEMELLPTPNLAQKIEMVYRTYVPPLGPSDDTVIDNPESNWLLVLAPDAYLYGTLMEAAPYLHDDERIGVWSAGVQAAFDGLNRLSQEASYNAGPLVVRRRGGGYS